ncbi:MAG: hypothetical protein IJX19_05785 [Clostridia bacterium]|nr:hypothetical protein [Clostridia bacterium]
MMKRFLTFLLCLSLLLTAVACKKKQQEPEEPSAYATYDDVVAEFTERLTAKYNGEELTAPNTEDMDERETAIAEALYDIVDAHRIDATYPINLGYGYKDVDGNGTSEMFLLSDSFFIRAIFTLSEEGEPILLESSSDLSCYITFAGGDRFFMTRSNVTDHIEEATFYTCHVDGDQMAYDLVYGAIYDQEKRETLEWFQIVDGNRISIDEETFDELYWEYERTTLSSYSDEEVLKFAAPYIHFPMNEPINTEGLPVADFSSYEAILNTCRALASIDVDRFEYVDWIRAGKYDDLFTFPDDTSFEYYNRLLYAAVMNDFENFDLSGYDLIDLNGDGQDELVLLSETYNIKAIFTQKNGVPVLLKDATNARNCWLDEEGFIRTDLEYRDKVEYTTYEITKDGVFKSVSSLRFTEVGYYLIKDGKTEKISREEYRELYEDYVCYPEYVKPNEYTRDVSKLTYTPLTQPTKDPVQAAVGKTWRTGGSMEETTGKNNAYYAIYMTLKNVTDTQMDMNFKYAFTYYYKDPNQESTVSGIS